jgi:hypothetical protein
LRKNRKFNYFIGLLAIHHIYSKFEEGKGSTTYSELLKKCGHNSLDLDFFLKLFTEKELIYRENKGPFMPTKSSKNIMLKELFDLINEAGNNTSFI